MTTAKRALLLAGIAAALMVGYFGMHVQGAPAATGVVYGQLPDPAGGYYHASENGTDYDQFVWDDFILPSSQTITEIHWRGNYDPVYATVHGPLTSFTVAIYASIPGGYQPDVVNLPPLMEYILAGNAGETLAGTFGGVVMYDYSYVLPLPFQANAGAKYWVYLQASQSGVPDWCIAKGTGGDGQHFHGFINYPGGTSYHYAAGDTAFALLGPETLFEKIFLPLIIK
jgi:hypothetical protein